jgi:DDE superfamily endonuclease
VAAIALVVRGDPDRDRTLTALRQQLTELPRGAVVLAEDETHINLLPWVRATWIAHGQRQQVVIPGTNRRRSIFGAVDLASGRFFYLVARTAVSATFIAFLERLQQAYPAAPVVWDLAGEPTPPPVTRGRWGRDADVPAAPGRRRPAATARRWRRGRWRGRPDPGRWRG